MSRRGGSRRRDEKVSFPRKREPGDFEATTLSPRLAVPRNFAASAARFRGDDFRVAQMRQTRALVVQTARFFLGNFAAMA